MCFHELKLLQWIAMCLQRTYCTSCLVNPLFLHSMSFNLMCLTYTHLTSRALHPVSMALAARCSIQV